MAMTRLDIEIDGRMAEAEIDIVRSGASTMVTLISSGVTATAEVSQPEPGRYLLLRGKTVYRCDIDLLADGTPTVVVNGRRIMVTVQDRRHRRRELTVDDRAINLTSPMPGRVVACLVEPGSMVAKGQGVIVVEAMKMQNEIQAPRAGCVSEVRTTPGQTVDAGQILAVLE